MVSLNKYPCRIIWGNGRWGRRKVASISNPEFGRVVLFFWPMDFTYVGIFPGATCSGRAKSLSSFVCPTEILAFNRALPKFHELGTQLIGMFHLHKQLGASNLVD
jgi:peroxiredoxin